MGSTYLSNDQVFSKVVVRSRLAGKVTPEYFSALTVSKKQKTSLLETLSCNYFHTLFFYTHTHTHSHTGFLGGPAIKISGSRRSSGEGLGNPLQYS